MLAKVDEIFNNGELDKKQKVEALYKYYNETVLEELKRVYRQALQLRLNEELMEYQVSVILS